MSELTASFKQLVCDLEAARRITEAAQDVQSRRDRLADVNASLVRFLRREGVPTYLYQPLLSLNAALIDVEEGRNNPLLQPEKMEAGAEKKLRIEAQQLGTAAALVDILKDELRLSGAEAHKQAAKAAGTDLPTLRTFRSNVRKGRAPASAIEAYSQIKQSLRSLPFYTPRAGADFILAKLVEIEKG